MPSPNRLLYISHGNIPSKWAHTFQVMNMSQAFSRLLTSVTLLTGRGLLPSPLDRTDLSVWYGIRPSFRIVRLPVHWRLKDNFFTHSHSQNFAFASAVYARLKAPDLVYTRSVEAGCLCARLGLKTLIETHAKPDSARVRKLAATAAQNKSLLGIVTISVELKNRYERLGIPGQKIFSWPSAVDLDAFRDLPHPDALRQELNIPEDSFVASYCGHLYEGRGLDVILACAKRLPGVIFAVAGGWDKGLDALKLAVREVPNVRLLGFLPQPKAFALMAASDALLMPYSPTCETAAWMSPMKLFESMAARRPVIATALPALQRHLKDGDNALLIPPDNSEALKHAIEKLKSDAGLGQALAGKAYESVRPFTWENRAREILTQFNLPHLDPAGKSQPADSETRRDAKTLPQNISGCNHSASAEPVSS